MDFTPCQPSSLSCFKPYPAAFHIALEQGELLALLDLDWTARRTSSISEFFPRISSGRKHVSFPTSGWISMAPTITGTKSPHPVLSCDSTANREAPPPPIVHLSTSPTDLHISHFLFAFLGLNQQNRAQNLQHRCGFRLNISS